VNRRARPRLDRVFHALGDPTRLGMIERLSRGPASVTELAAPLAMALPSVLKHLRVLEDGGLVSSTKAGRVRTYELERGALGAIDDWVARHQTALEKQLDRLGAFLAAADDGDD
jgi:DNA-binding transcriptional ArsR family regulator